jgi:hypothetical protein
LTEPLFVRSALERLSGCTTLYGSLFIGDTTNIDSLLPGLANTVNITGSISLQNLPKLTSLDGLQNLERVDGSLTFANLSILADVTHRLERLVFVGRNFTLKDLPLLPELPLPALSSSLVVGGTLSLSNLPNITSLYPLSSVALTPNVSRVELTQLHGLTSLEGLPDLSNTQSFSLRQNNRLTSVQGVRVAQGLPSTIDILDNFLLASLSLSPGGDCLFDAPHYNNKGVAIVISRNPSLAYVHCTGSVGPSHLASLSLVDNALLTDFTAFHTVTHLSGALRVARMHSLRLFVNMNAVQAIEGDVVFDDNGALTNVSMEALASVGGSVEFTSNVQLIGVTTPLLASIGSSLVVRLNSRLSRLGATSHSFVSLAFVGGSLTFDSNPRLLTVRAFASALHTVSGEIVFVANPELCASTVRDMFAPVATSALTVTGSGADGSVVCSISTLEGLTSVTSVDGALKVSSAVTNTSKSAWADGTDPLYSAQVLLNALDSVVIFLQLSPSNGSASVEEAVLDALNSMADPSNSKSLRGVGANGLSLVVEKFAHALSVNVTCNASPRNAAAANLKVETGVADGTHLNQTYSVAGGGASIMIPSSIGASLTIAGASTASNGSPSQLCYVRHFVVYEQSTFASHIANQTEAIDSAVISFGFEGVVTLDIVGAEQVEVALVHRSQSTGSRTCVFWDTFEEVWSTRGCEMVSSDALRTV